MKKYVRYLLIVISGLVLVACSKGKLQEHKTADKLLTFQLSSDFSKNETYPRLDIYENGRYRLYIENNLKPNKILDQMFDGYKSGERTYRYAGYTIENSMRVDKTDLAVQNENGYDFVAFYGEIKDPSALLPTYYQIYYVLMKTPHHYVSIQLKHQSRRSGAIDKTEAVDYIAPIIKAMKESGNLIYSPVIEPLEIK